MVERWREVVIAARKVVDDCTSDCSSACVDCLLHYRNAHYHRHLDRKCAGERLGELGEQLKLSHDIPARLPGKVHEGETTNPPEEVLRHMLERAGFSGLKCQHPIDLSKPLGVTTPDFFFEDPEGHFEGICIYLDGMSDHLHGKPETAARDRQIRDELRSRFYEVIEIRASQLSDREAMRRHFLRLGRLLVGKEQTVALAKEMDWFRQGESGA